MRFSGTTDIKHFVGLALRERQAQLKDTVVIDVPAGSGHSTQILLDLGARVEAFDLVPDFFDVPGLICTKADLTETLPIPSAHADMVLCQEGIEHVTDQYKLLCECSRILKLNGRLLLTTPNESNLRMRLSTFLSESEYFYKMQPPNELDSIWYSGNSGNGKVYFGHIALVGIQKLRLIARMAGFDIMRIHHLRTNTTSLVLFPFFYPFILLVNLAGYRRAMRLKTDADETLKREIYGEILRLAIDPRILTDGHLFIEFVKKRQPGELASMVSPKYKETDIIT